MNSNDSTAARHRIRLAAIVVLALIVAGLLAIPTAGSRGYTSFSLFFEQFAQIEGPALVIVGAFTVVLFLGVRRVYPMPDRLPQPRYRPWVIVAVSLTAAALVFGGIHFVFRNFLLADDEYSAWFQALIFARGRTSAVVGPQWCQWIAALTPSSIAASRGCTWQLGYLPIHSLFHAGFIAVGADRLGGPVAAGLVVLLTASIAQKLWPLHPTRAYVAALFTATSTQVLFMSMTMFSMPTHLLLSSVWLWLYVDDRRWSNMLLPWVGVLALGVHSPFPHALLIPPFVFRYLRDRRFALLAYVAVVYALGLSYWYGYLTLVPQGAPVALASASATATVARNLFHWPSVAQAFTTAMHLALVPTWNAPIEVTLAIAAMLSWRRLDAFAKDATLSVLLIVVARTLMPTPQGEGWGYRFIYDGLGLLALLAALGFEVLAEAIGSRVALRFLAASLAASLVVQIPLRAVQVNSVIAPYRGGWEWMSTLPYDAVIFPADMVKWGRQLVRNDPFLRDRPKILSRRDLTPGGRESLMRDRSKRVLTISPDNLATHRFPMAGMSLGSFQVGR